MARFTLLRWFCLFVVAIFNPNSNAFSHYAYWLVHIIFSVFIVCKIENCCCWWQFSHAVPCAKLCSCRTNNNKMPVIFDVMTIIWWFNDNWPISHRFQVNLLEGIDKYQNDEWIMAETFFLLVWLTLYIMLCRSTYEWLSVQLGQLQTKHIHLNYLIMLFVCVNRSPKNVNYNGFMVLYSTYSC